jgi:hypothetical protein
MINRFFSLLFLTMSSITFSAERLSDRISTSSNGTKIPESLQVQLAEFSKDYNAPQAVTYRDKIFTIIESLTEEELQRNFELHATPQYGTIRDRKGWLVAQICAQAKIDEYAHPVGHYIHNIHKKSEFTSTELSSIIPFIAVGVVGILYYVMYKNSKGTEQGDE